MAAKPSTKPAAKPRKAPTKTPARPAAKPATTAKPLPRPAAGDIAPPTTPAGSKELEAKARADAVAAGVKISPASPAFAAEIRKLAEPLEQAWLADAKAAGVDGPAALAFYKQQAQDNAK